MEEYEVITDQAKHDRDVHREPGRKDDKDSKLERIAEQIVPPSQEISDEDLKDPGRMTPKAPPTDNRT
jgi:hypothetical protein